MTDTYLRGGLVSRAGMLTAALVAIAIATMIVFAATASAAKLGGKTTLAPNAATVEALTAAGIAVAPAGNAGAGDDGISFPITGGALDLDAVAGKVKHSGGLTFSDHGTSLTVENFVVKVGAKNVIRADVAGGGKVRLADLDLDDARIKERGGKVVISNVQVMLANRAAKALVATFGIPNLAGADLGEATVKVKP